MKNVFKRELKKSHCLVLSSIIAVGIFLGLSQIQKTKAVETEGIVKGIFTEKINDIDHEKIVEYGPSGIYNIDDMLCELGIEKYPEDKINVFPDPSIGIGSKIEITRANPIKVIDAGREITYRTWASNFSDFFSEQNIEIGPDDIIDVSMDDKITKDKEINIIRVAMSEITEYEQIDYDVIDKDDPTMEKGLTEVEQYPEYGEKKLTYSIKQENGDIVSRDLVGTEVTKEPVDKILLHGTKVVVLGTGTATWYDLIGGMTAASNTLPYGTKVLVRASNGNEVVVTVVDHGIQGGAVIDLSDEAFSQLAPLGAGRINVTLEKP